MKKELQLILLILIFSISAGMRMSIMGWLFFIGIGTIIIFGIIHFYIHIKAIDSLNEKGNFNILKILISHLLFAMIIILQTDTGDNNDSCTGIGYAFAINDSFIQKNSEWIFVVLIIFYSIISGFILRNPKIEKMTDDTRRFLPLTIISALLLSFVVNYGVRELRESILSKREKSNKTTMIDKTLTIKNYAQHRTKLIARF